MSFSVGTAYLLWFLSGFGALGLHRFYLRRVGSGLLWFFTGGLFMIGAIIDFFLIPELVRDANMRLRLEQALWDRPPQRRPAQPSRSTRERESLERVILRTAKSNKGLVTPGHLALEADVPLEQAHKALEKLSSKGFAELRVRDGGTIAYYFSEFDEDGGPGERV